VQLAPQESRNLGVSEAPMLLALVLSFTLVTGSGPMDEALKATEAPNSLRAAFTVHMQSRTAQRIYRFDPRLPETERWQVIWWEGDDDELEAAAAEWAFEAAPDGRLFPDDLRVSLGRDVAVDDFEQAWRLSFRHAPSHNDGEFDVWAAERLSATAWLDPIGERFMRIDYTLPAPVRGPEGGRLTQYNQTYLLETEPRWGMSYVSSFAIDLEAKAAFRTMQRSYSARITSVEFFFANKAEEMAFEDRRLQPAPERFGVELAGR
jgi:hypothetical protein